MPKKIRQIRIEGNIAYVPLTQGYEAVIDAADAEIVGYSNWSAAVIRRKNKSVMNIYATSRRNRKTIYMHREILHIPAGMEADHIDNDGINNRRSNLRVVTPAQNKFNMPVRCDNKSGRKGVSWNSARKKWQVHIQINGKGINIGGFDDLDKAAEAYAVASAKLHGEFGRIS